MNLDLENEKVILEKDGKVIDCDILFTFDSEETMKSYVGYTDHSIAPNGRKNIYVSAYNPFNTVFELENITNRKELAMVNRVLQELDEQANA